MSLDNTILTFSQHVRKKQYEQALDTFNQILRQLYVSRSTPYLPEEQSLAAFYRNEEERTANILKSWATLLSDGAFRPSKYNITSLLCRLDTLHNLYFCSKQQNLDRVIKTIKKRIKGPADIDSLLKIQLAHCPTSNLQLDFKGAQLSPQFIFVTKMAAISSLTGITHKGDRARNEAIEYLASCETPPALDNIPCDDLLLGAWMKCSYSGHPDKHAVKATLNRLLGQDTPDSLPAPATGNRQGKPVLAIALEVFNSSHAMFRCFAGNLLPLKMHFHTVGICAEHMIDEHARNIFDEVLTVDASKSRHFFQDLKSLLLQLQPDVLYYPSVGMNLDFVRLANRRLAPVQIMGLGHPATSMSPVMDYVIAAESLFGDAGLFSETIVGLQDNAIENMALPHSVSAGEETDPEVIRVAVSAAAHKITADFMDALEEINRQSERKIQFLFFIGYGGYLSCGFHREITSKFPSAQVYPLVHYESYLQELASCQVYLSTFPFGGTNSIIDAILLGIPFVNLKGNEPATTVDSVFLELIGAPEWLTAHNSQEYISVALRLIDDTEDRLKVREHFLREENTRPLFHCEQPEDPANAIHWIYQNHEKLKSAKQKFWCSAQRLANPEI